MGFNIFPKGLPHNGMDKSLDSSKVLVDIYHDYFPPHNIIDQIINNYKFLILLTATLKQNFCLDDQKQSKE